MNRRAVFVDTWAWVAAAVRDDPDHAKAVAVQAELQRGRARRVTSHMVLAEALTRLRYDVSLASAIVVAEAVEEMAAGGILDVVAVDEHLWSAALTWFRRLEDQRFSFVDCTSFAIMADHGIAEALTADHHFATAGFVPLGIT